MNLKISLSQNNPLCEICLALFLCYEQICAGIGWILTGLNIGNDFSFIRWGFIIFIMVGTVWTFISRIMVRGIYKDIVVVGVFFAVMYAFSMLNESNAIVILENNLMFSTFLECIPVFILFHYVDDYSRLWKYMRILAVSILVIFVFAFFVYNVGGTSTYRTFSAGLTYASLIFVCEWLLKGDKRWLAPSVIAMILIATCGRRSSFLVIGFCFALILFYKRNFRVLIPAGILFVILFLFRQQIFMFFYDFCYAHGVRPRILYRIAIGTIGDDSYRFEMWSYSIQKLLSSPVSMIFGYGLGGERVFLREYYQGIWETTGKVHSIIFEVLCQYGIIGGTLLLFWVLLYAPVKTYRRVKKNGTLLLLYIFAVSLLVEMLFQSDYLTDKYFFFLLSIYMVAARLEKEKAGKRMLQ